MGEVVKFPVKGTRIKKWFDEACVVYHNINEASAHAWIRKIVPVQFHTVVKGNLKTYIKRGLGK